MRPADSKEAKFFCESCGSEVPRKSRFCPTCGKFFASVRCPECGKTGSPDDFKDGCPECGYAPGNTQRNQDDKPADGAASRSRRKSRGIRKAKREIARKAGADSGPPAWAYFVAVIVLAGLIIALYSCL